jgi:aspartyl protease family protein
MSGDDTATFFYLLLLLVMVGFFGLFSGRIQLSKSLQQAAIWGLIFFGVITAYGFKDVFIAQVDGSKAIAISDDTIALRRAGDGHFYADLMINGVNVPFVVDTGASEMVLNERDAKRVGIETDKLNYFGTASTANGIVKTAAVTLGVVILGPVKDFDVRASVNGGELEDSLLGMAYLDRFRELRIQGDTLYLTR